MSTATGGAQAPGFFRTRLGSFETIALHDGVVQFDRPAGFVRNASDAEVGDAFASGGLPRDKVTLTFNPLAVNTGEQIVLIDTGIGENSPMGSGSTMANLAAAGIRPEDVGTVIISHFHSDHIGGLRRADGQLTYPNAAVMVPKEEWAFWMDDAKMAAAPEGQKSGFELSRKVFGSMDVRQFAWGEEIVPGFKSVQVSGHTPGMAAVEITSGGETLLYVADITNNPLLFVRHPEWQLAFDMAPDKSVSTRRRVLDRAAAEHLRLFFFHAPFPSTGYVVKNGDGYEYLPAMWRVG